MRIAVLGLSLGCGGLLALACASSTDQVEGYSAFKPASSQQRAQARKERDARKKALIELTAKPDAGKPSPPPRPPPPPPPTPVPVVAASASAAADAGPPPDASVAVDAGPAPLDQSALCDKVCGRVVVCAKEMMGKAPPGMSSALIGQMVEKMRSECDEECTKTSDKERLAKGEECLAKPSCDEFVACVRELRDEKPAP